jgi:hypothetical protein
MLFYYITADIREQGVRKDIWAKAEGSKKGDRENFLMSFMISVAHQVLFGSLNQGNEMGGACGKHGGKMKPIKGLVKNPEGKRNWENLGVDGRITLIFILKQK